MDEGRWHLGPTPHPPSASTGFWFHFSEPGSDLTELMLIQLEIQTGTCSPLQQESLLNARCPTPASGPKEVEMFVLSTFGNTHKWYNSEVRPSHKIVLETILTLPSWAPIFPLPPSSTLPLGIPGLASTTHSFSAQPRNLDVVLDFFQFLYPVRQSTS